MDKKSKQLVVVSAILGIIVIILLTAMALAKYVVKDEKDIEVTLRDVRIDENEIEIIPSSWTNGNVTVSISTKKNGEVYYKINENGEWKKYEKNFEVEENCNIYAKIKYTDGESPETVKEVTNIDKIKPTVEIVNPEDPITPDIQEYTILAGETTTDISKKLIANDEDGSGLKTLNYAYSQSNTTEPTTYEEFKNEAIVTKSATGGNWYIWTKVLDNAGNRAEETKISPAYNVGYQVIYDANGGTGAPKEQRKVHGTELKISETIPTRTGYEFQGWATTNTATTAELKAGENYTTDKAVKLYAVWKKYKYLNTTTSKYYMKLSDALNEVKDKETIKAMDYAIETTAPTLATAKAITFDLNGQTVVMSNVTLTNNGTLTIAGASGTLTGSGADTITNNGTLIKNTATEIASSATADYYVLTNNGTVTISEGKVTSPYRGIKNAESGTLNITGGNISTTHSYGTDNSGILEISGGNITSDNSIGILNRDSGNLSIMGGTIKGEEDTIGSTGTGGIISISGGTITSNEKAAVSVCKGTTVTITGGNIVGGLYGVWSNSDTNITIGENDGKVSIESPSISSRYYGIFMQSGKINFYDGVIKGASGKSIGGTAEKTVEETATNCVVVKTTSGSTETAVLGPSAPKIEKEYGILPNCSHNAANLTVSGSTYTTTSNDPMISFGGLKRYTNVTGVIVKFKTALTKDIGVLQVFYSTSGSGYSEANSKIVNAPAGSTEIKVDIPKGTYDYIRVDIGSVSGVSYELDDIYLITSDDIWNNGNISVKLSSEDIGNGIKQYECYENEAWTTRALNTNNNLGIITYTVTRNETIRFRAVDNNGVVSPETVIGVKIDKVSPIVAFGTNGSTTAAKTASTTVSVTDNDSGVKTENLKYLWSVLKSGIYADNFTGNNSGSFSSGETISLPNGNGGDYYLWILAQDNAGNQVIIQSDKFVVSSIEPEADILVSTTTLTAGTVTMTIKPYAPTVLYDCGYVVTTVRDKYGDTAGRVFPTKSYGGAKFRISGAVKTVTTANSATTTGVGFQYKNTSDEWVWPIPQNVATGNVTNVTDFSKICTIPTDYKEALKPFFQIDIPSGTAGYKVEYTNIKYEYFDYTKIKNVTVNGTEVTLTNGIGTYEATTNGTYNIVVTDIYGNSRTFTQSITNINKAARNITFNNNFGENEKHIEIKLYGNKFESLPTPTRTGYTFEGWYTEPTGGTKIETTTAVPSEDTTYYAHWSINTYTITYSTNMRIDSVYYAASPFVVKEVTKDGEKMWNATLSKTTGTNSSWAYIGFPVYDYEVGATYRIRAKTRVNSATNIGLTLRNSAVHNDYWTEGNAQKGIGQIPGQWCDYYLDRQLKDSYTDSSGTKYTTSPRIEIWTGDLKITDSVSSRSVDMDVKDVYVEKITTQTKKYNETLGTLDTPKRKGYTFDGWYTERTGGTKISSTTIPTADTTYYAHWSEIQVGDTINYSPSGTYNWNKSYATSNETGTQTLNSASGQSFNVSKWKVLSVDKSTGNIEMVPATTPSGTVTLQGAQGYNNAVKLLNDACSSLYGNSTKGITARSIKEEDFVKVGGTKWANAKAMFVNDGIKYANQAQPYTSGKFYPIMYKKEANSVIDGTKTENGLNQSEQTSFILKNDEGATDGYLNAITSIQPYQTYYNTTDYITTTNLLEGYAKILLPNGSSTQYWVATRKIVVYSSICGFGIHRIYAGYFRAYDFYNSHSEVDVNSYAVFPVVSLNTQLLQKSTDGTYNVK